MGYPLTNSCYLDLYCDAFSIHRNKRHFSLFLPIPTIQKNNPFMLILLVFGVNPI